MQEYTVGESRLLKQSFEEFTRATARLQDAYTSLEMKFQQINLELERKNLELKKALAEKERIGNYLTNILESLNSGVVVTDENGYITMMNESAEKLSPVLQNGGRQDCLGALFGDFFPYLQDRHMDEQGAIPPETRCRVQGRVVELYTNPMIATDREDRGTIFVLRDVTRMEKLEEMAKRSEKFAAMEELAANIAHEIRNPLGSIELFASLLMKEPESPRSRDRAYEIIKSVKTVNNRISNLLLFTKRPQPVFRRVRLHELIDDVVIFAKPIIENEEIRLTVSYDESDPAVEGDGEMLKQVFLNLILNALQAMPDGGEFTIETRVNVSEGHFRQHESSDVEILFDDRGTGIPAGHMPRIFDPFFTTKDGGSGLGLAIVHNIIDMHGGAVVADHNEWGGTLMNITLPVISHGRKSGMHPPGK